MACSDQPDPFEAETQPEPFDEDVPPVLYHGDPDRVRVRLHKILDEARAAETMPWDAEETRLYCTIFPQMTNWLPDDEAAQLRSEFEAELARLDAG
jgi:hypothetical protein